MGKILPPGIYDQKSITISFSHVAIFDQNFAIGSA